MKDNVIIIGHIGSGSLAQIVHDVVITDDLIIAAIQAIPEKAHDNRFMEPEPLPIIRMDPGPMPELKEIKFTQGPKEFGQNLKRRKPKNK